MTEKQCRGPCGLVKPLDEFYKRPTGKDGHFNECKLCYSARNKANRLLPANKERERDRNAAWRAANPERWKVLRKRAYEKSLKNGTSTKSRVTRQARVKAANPTGHVVSLKGIVERDGMHCFICNKPIEDKLQLTYTRSLSLAGVLTPRTTSIRRTRAATRGSVIASQMSLWASSLLSPDR